MKARAHAGRQVIGRVVVALLLALVSLCAAGRALGYEQTYHTDAGSSYVCGSPSLGMSGSLVSALGITCAGDDLPIPATPTVIIATFGSPGALNVTRALNVQGKELYVDVSAPVAGTLTFEIAYRGLAGGTYTPMGSVSVPFAGDSPQGGTRVDLTSIRGTVPANSQVFLRLRKDASSFQGTLHLGPAFPGARSIRMTIYAGVWHVNPDGSGDFIAIKDAVESASVIDGDHVLVADGVYQGTRNTTILFGGKRITLKSENGPERCVIDGEFQYQLLGFLGSETNGTVVEGFTLKRANNPAVTISTGYPLFRNCVFSDNEAVGGGAAVYLDGTRARAAVFEDCTFVSNRYSNSVAGYYGGAVAVVNTNSATSARATFRNCTFVRNSSHTSGGAVYVSAALADVRVESCAFLENGAGRGGAIAARGGGSVRVTNTRFVGNKAESGGAVYSEGGVSLANCVFASGEAQNGAALYHFDPNAYGTPIPTAVNHCTFTGNYAHSRGAAVTVAQGQVTLVNSVLWGDSQGQAGAGKEIYVPTSSVNRLDIGNVVVESGIDGMWGSFDLPGPEGIKPVDGGNIIDRDPLLASPEFPYLLPGSSAVDAGSAYPTLPTGTPVETADIDGVGNGASRGLTACAAGDPDIGAYEFHGDCGTPVPVVSPARVVLVAREGGSPPDPVRIPIANASATQLRWRVSSDAGWLTVRPPEAGETDAETDTATLIARLEDAGVPLAAGEHHATVLVEVDPGDPVAFPADAARVVEVVLHVSRERRFPGEYATIQAALDDVEEGDEVVVADGVWNEYWNAHLITRSRSVTLRSENGYQATTLDCGGSGRGITVPSMVGGHVVLQGLTVRNCQGASTPREGGGLRVGPYATAEVIGMRFQGNVLGGGGSMGGGIYAAGKVFVSRSVFQGNDADDGGGIYQANGFSSVLEVRDSSFDANTAGDGGGIYLYPSTAALVLKSTFTGNTSTATRGSIRGGGVYVTGSLESQTLIEACLFKGNGYGGSSPGGGAYVTAPNVRVGNSVFVSNNAGTSIGGGLYLGNWSSAASNCTFRANTANQGGGVYVGSGTVENCAATGNTATGLPSTAEIGPSGSSYVFSSFIDNGWTLPDARGNFDGLPQFVDVNTDDYRLQRTSDLIDKGRTVNWIFSDYRGSVRAVDGDDDGRARFDVGACEYSRYYGGIGEDSTAKAFRDLKINGTVAATGYEYRVTYQTKDPFPSRMDERVDQAGEYEVRLLLVSARGRMLELGTWVMRLGPQYTIPVVFGAEHVGVWRLRLELASDPNQFVLSDEISIEYKELVTYPLGRELPPPAGALAGERPDVDYPAAVYWSTETNRLYAIAPYPVQLTWYANRDRTIPLLVMGIIQTPPDPVFHVADAPPVVLRPEGTRFGSVGILWSDSSASISSDRFTAPQDGWTTLLFRDSVNSNPELRELFTVVRTLTWKHQGTQTAQDPYYPSPPPSPPPLPPVDPTLPIEKTAVIGELILDAEHDQTGACSGGHVVFELAPYDGAGADRAYDRPTRGGQIFAVNDDDPNTEEDDLVVIWYRRQGSVEGGDPGVCWPFKPVRYDPVWPTPSVTCPGDPAGNCNRIEIAGGLVGDTRLPVGSGALPPDTFGAWENMIVYDQPDRRLPGFNPNEEHAMLFTSQGTPYPGVFPLRSDLNRYRETEAPGDDWDLGRHTSRPYSLLKHRDPVSGEWRFKVFFVTPGMLTYTPVAGNEFNPPYPLNQFVFGPCRDRASTGHNGTWTDAELYQADGSNISTAEALVDKDKKIFFIRGGVSVRAYNFYRLQPGFWYDLDNNGWPDAPAGTCVPFLDGWDPATSSYVPFDGQPAAITSVVGWPETPTLFVGETLADAKMQAGETVGLPNVKDQCIVSVLHDETDNWSLPGNQGVRLFDPLKEWTAPLTGGLPQQITLDPPTGTGSRVRFLDLPPQLQSRLTYNDTADPPVLKLKGEYITTTGEPVLLLNTLSTREVNLIRAIYQTKDNAAPFLAAVDALKAQGDSNLAGKPSIARWEADFKALSAGSVENTGYVTLAFNNHADCPAPTMLSVIEVDCPLYRGDLKVVESPNPFEEKITLRHNGDFGGNPDARWFEWVYLQGYSGIPEGPSPNNMNGENWLPFNPANSATKPTPPLPGTQLFAVPEGGTRIFARGLVDITPEGTGQQLLPDRWFAVRYRYADALTYHTDPPPSGPVCTMVSPWTPPQLAEGWVKRVMKKINLFDQRVKDFHKTDADTVASMIAQAGRAYEGDVALSDEPEYLKRVGLVELYQTLLNRALALSVDADPPDPSLRDAVLFAANRLASLYMLLGNEAYADSADPTVGFGTQDGQYGAMAPSIFAFQNQMDTLLDEEFALLAGRDDEGMRPFYNRLPWNSTIADGEVAYRQVYNITDVADATGAMEPDGEINEYDAKFLYPQGHGDAWGHYLSAIKRLYNLITHDAVDAVWVPTVEAILVAQAPVEVDYRDERLFATAAAARARAGADLVNLAYRRSYDEDPQRQWLGYRDSNALRGWGLAEWASRAGQGAYIDWAVGNALLPSVATEIRKVETFAAPVQTTYVLSADYARGDLQIFIDPAPDGSTPPLNQSLYPYSRELIRDQVQAVDRTWVTFTGALPPASFQIMFRVALPAEGIKKVDRTTVVDLHEIPAQYDAIQSVLDQADRGLNPLGVAKDTVPFDIDPALVTAGQTHFEQVYNRALQTLQNAVTVFDYASQSSQMLRRQQDRLDDFKRTVEDREADFTSRLVEVFGYPYPEDCGPGKLYATGYCETGPDIYHYMYVEPSHLMGAANTDKKATTAPRELRYTVTFRDLSVDAAGALTETEVPVEFTVDEDRRFGIVKPAAWTGNRRAPGALQLARADLLQLQGRFERAILEYDALIGQIEDQAGLIIAQNGLNAEELRILQTAKGQQQGLNDSILNGRESAASLRAAAQDAIFVANIAMEAIPKVIGLATDGMSALRGIALGVGQGISLMLNQQADDSAIGELSSQQAKEIAGAEANIQITAARAGFAVQQQILQLESLVRREAILRQELYTLVEGLQQSAGRYLNALASGERILEERLRFRQQTAAQVQDYRYTDMTFRVFRNDALQKYKAQLDLAGRYAYLAAKAYDYETTLLDASSMAGRAFLAGIVKERSIGTVLGGQPLTGTGLADVLRRLSMNFQVLKPQLGFNNPQVETNRFSLRRELFRVRFDGGSDETWRGALAAHRVPDLWEVPEFRRFCRPFAAVGAPQPGLVIPFRTTVTSGLNFFGWPLGGGDSYYSAANFATKVRSVGVWFSNYNATGLAQTPRVYLVPAGEDVLRSPTGGSGDIRSWHVLDQKLPMPQLVNTRDMAGDRGWIPAVDTILDEFGAPRRHADFKAHHDSGYLEPTELTYDTRLVGRSVWNTKWMLIIPGRNLLYDPDEGLDTFVEGPEVYGGAGERSGNGISDIKLFFTTYAYSGY